MTIDSLCNDIQFAKCCSAQKFLRFMDAEEKGHDVSCLRGELMYMSMAIRSLQNFIPVGTLLSDPGSDACGWTSTIIGFAPIPPPPLTFTIINLTVDGTPIPYTAGPYNTIIEGMNAVMNALAAATGLQWHYVQIPPSLDFQFYVCTDYTQNGLALQIWFEVGQEGPMGNITMNPTLSGGIAPATPIYQTDDGCLKQLQAQGVLGTLDSLCSCEEDETPPPANIELRETLNLELRENGN